MAPIISDMTVHFRHDRSITQMMLESTTNASPNKIISEDILTGKSITYQGLREDAFKAAWALRHRLGMKTGDTVTIIGRSCVRLRALILSDIYSLKIPGGLHCRNACGLGSWWDCQVSGAFLLYVPDPDHLVRLTTPRLRRRSRMPSRSSDPSFLSLMAYTRRSCARA